MSGFFFRAWVDGAGVGCWTPVPSDMLMRWGRCFSDICVTADGDKRGFSMQAGLRRWNRLLLKEAAANGELLCDLTRFLPVKRMLL